MPKYTLRRKGKCVNYLIFLMEFSLKKKSDICKEFMTLRCPSII